VFEVLACGAFLITDRQRDIFSLFGDGVHLVGFDDAEDLRRKIRHYLDHPEKRQAIAARGREEALRRHTYVHRLGELSSALTEAGMAEPERRKRILHNVEDLQMEAWSGSSRRSPSASTGGVTTWRSGALREAAPSPTNSSRSGFR
jgi:hypothetical protein